MASASELLISVTLFSAVRRFRRAMQCRAASASEERIAMRLLRSMLRVRRRSRRELLRRCSMPDEDSIPSAQHPASMRLTRQTFSNA